jgi:hypothetical protein
MPVPERVTMRVTNERGRRNRGQTPPMQHHTSAIVIKPSMSGCAHRALVDMAEPDSVLGINVHRSSFWRRHPYRLSSKCGRAW